MWATHKAVSIEKLDSIPIDCPIPPLKTTTEWSNNSSAVVALATPGTATRHWIPIPEWVAQPSILSLSRIRTAFSAVLFLALGQVAGHRQNPRNKERRNKKHRPQAEDEREFPLARQ